MKNATVLTVTSLLSILLFTVHLASDVVLGKDAFDRGMWIGVLMVTVWLYATVALRGRIAGAVIVLLFSLLAFGVLVLHTPAAGMSAEFLARPGAYLFVWTLLAMGTTGLFSFVLAAQELWRLLRARRTP